MTEEVGTEERTLYGVRYEDMLLMLRLLAPQLASAFGHNIASRGCGERDPVAEARCAPARMRAHCVAQAKRPLTQSRSVSVPSRCGPLLLFLFPVVMMEPPRDWLAFLCIELPGLPLPLFGAGEQQLAIALARGGVV